MHTRVQNSLKLITFSFAISLASAYSFAQPSAGEIYQRNRDLEPPSVLLPGLIRGPSSIELKPLKPQAGQLSFVVKHFNFEGNSKISSQELSEVVKAFLNQPITFDDLNRVTDIVAEFYRARGWLVRVIIPQQDITEGVVLIHIIEAKLGGLKIDNQSSTINTKKVEEWIYSYIPQDRELSLSELEHAVLTLDDFPDISVTSSLQGGEKPGDTTLLLTVLDKPWYNGQATMDNFGDRNTGRTRGSALVNVNGLTGLGDQLSVYGTYSEGNNYGRLSFTTPIDMSGLRLGVNATAMTYHVINPSLSATGSHGATDSAGVEASYPVLRSRAANLMATFNWTYNQFKNWNINGINQDQTYNSNVAQLGVSGNSIDEWMNGGSNTGFIQISMGNNGRDVMGHYNTSYNVAGNFYKIRYNFSRSQVLDSTLFAYLSWSGQWANKNMDSSEQFYMSGPVAVRAYSSGGAATNGNLVTVELRQNFLQQFQAIAFYDLGLVQTWKNNNLTVNTMSNSYALQGAGLALSWLGPYNANVKATWARRLGSLDSTVANNITQSSGLSNNRFWLNLLLPF